jgi:hypothetical protein
MNSQSEITITSFQVNDLKISAFACSNFRVQSFHNLKAYLIAPKKLKTILP